MIVTLELLPWLILLSGSLVLPFASTWHIFHSPVLVLVLFVGYCFGEIMCIWDSYVYQKGVLCFLIHKSYVRSIKRYCFVRKYAAARKYNADSSTA